MAFLHKAFVDGATAVLHPSYQRDNNNQTSAKETAAQEKDGNAQSKVWLWL
jgi:hypothetical protein